MKKIPVIKSKHFVVYDCIFAQQIDVFVNYSPKQYQNWLNRNKIVDVEIKDFNNYAGWVSNYEDSEGRIKAIMFIPKFNWTIKDQGTLVHECTHAVIKIWQRNNIPWNADTQEFLAHSIGNLYQEIAKKSLSI